MTIAKDFPKLESPFVRRDINGAYVVTQEIAKGYGWCLGNNDIEGSGGSVRRDPYGTGSIVSLGAVDFGTKDEFYEECMVMEGRGYDEQALLVNGFTEEQIFDKSKQSVLELLVKFEGFCKAHDASIMGAWGNYDLKMLQAAYLYYGREWALPNSYANLKSISKEVLGNKRSGLSNTAKKLGMPPEPQPHIGINGASLAIFGYVLWYSALANPDQPSTFKMSETTKSAAAFTFLFLATANSAAASISTVLMPSLE